MTMVAVICNFYMIIALGSQMLGPELFLFPNIAFTSTVVLVVHTTVLSQLYVSSKLVTDVVKKQVLPKLLAKNERKWVEKHCLSCRPLKCYIGYVNYVDELAPLNFVNFCINQVVNLLMLG